MTVYLVGAGPGDPRLVTLRAAELIRNADAIVHDRLVDPQVLALVGPTTELHDVGKSPGGSIRQEDVNDLLLTLARRHSRVVRLKGGDPYVFGRGGEEAIALQQAGIPFEVVPGVSSVNGVLAYAGIPVTHRGLAASVTVVTGHLGEASTGGGRSGAPTAVDWEALGRLGGTVVVLMGVAHRAEIADRLLAGGRSPETPVAVVSRGTGPDQRTIRTTLAGLAQTEPSTPAVLVIGEVAALDLSWFESRPLFGWRVLVTRSRRQASALSELLRDAGADPIEVPAIEICEPTDGGEALRAALQRVHEFDWVAFSSANAVRAVFAELPDARALGGVRVAAIGKATASALADAGVRADLVPAVAVGEELAQAFGPADPPGTRVLLPQAAGARDVLAEGLSRLGYDVAVVEAYRTTYPRPSAEMAERLVGAQAITFTSSSTVEGYLEGYGAELVPPVVAAIGPITAATARSRGLHVTVEASEASVEAIVTALVEHAARVGDPGAT